MPTPASQAALNNLRDFSTLEWYVIPLLAIVLYIYTSEIKKARGSGNWEAILAGLTVFGMDFVNETVNGWIFALSNHSALWTTPGDTALRTMMGWNIEIMFMFAISGLIFYNTLSKNKAEKILGLPNRWFWAIGYAVFCVFVECYLNKGGHLVWEYPWWNRSFKGVWLIFFFGYFHFYVAAIIVLSLKTMKAKIISITSIYAVAILLNIIGFGLLGLNY
jgi:hypothetical protein